MARSKANSLLSSKGISPNLLTPRVNAFSANVITLENDDDNEKLIKKMCKPIVMSPSNSEYVECGHAIGSGVCFRTLFKGIIKICEEYQRAV
jgi:hypothetical protein